MTLVKVVGEGQVTLPAEAREALRLHDGDYLEVKPAAAQDRAPAWDRIMAIVSRPKWRGLGHESSDDELLDEAVEEIHAMRAEHEQSGS